ncbi:MAG: sigma-70 family RNA polymerase sigma factor, partial [Chloroflexota bacterium]|nr:sigma-70 family RNA polymerase sigma factor [Chloroflexota bacterium]
QHLPNYRRRSPSTIKGKRSDSFRNWVYRIATNAALDVLRRERETVDVDALPLAASNEGPEATVEGKERSEQVRQAVLALPPASRAALVLREYEALSYQEIADALDIPIGTVMSRLNYARGRLREMLIPHLEAL